VTSVGKSDLKMRQTLEEALSNAQLHAAGLETERDKLAEQLTHIKTRVILVRHQVFSCFSFYTQVSRASVCSLQLNFLLVILVFNII
jgi:hypothetical protein